MSATTIIEQRLVDNIAHVQRRVEANPINAGFSNNLTQAVSDLAQFYACTYPQRVVELMGVRHVVANTVEV